MRRITYKNPAHQRDSLETLRDLLTPGDTVYVITTQVARSGMSRRVKVLIPRPPVPAGAEYEGSPARRAAIRDITWHVGRALGWQLIDDGSWELRVDGAGMDMGFHTVYTLSRALFADVMTAGVPELGVAASSDPGYLLTKETL